MSRNRSQISATHRDQEHIVEMVETFCVANKIPQVKSNLLNLALDEVLSNIIKYAYGPTDRGKIDVELEYRDNNLVATVEDRGVAFDPLKWPMQVPSGPLQTRKEGGLGILFVRSLMNRVVYERCGDRNKVTLVIDVPST